MNMAWELYDTDGKTVWRYRVHADKVYDVRIWLHNEMFGIRINGRPPIYPANPGELRLRVQTPDFEAAQDEVEWHIRQGWPDAEE